MRVTVPSQRIVLVTSSLAGGGAERVVAAMARYWARVRRDVHVITLRADEDDSAQTLGTDVPVHRLRLIAENNPPFDWRHGLRLWRMRRALLDLRPGVVISFIDKLNTAVLLALTGTRVPVLATEHLVPWMKPVGQPWGFLRAAVYRRARAVISPVRAMTDWFAARLAGNFVTLRYPVELDLASPLPEARPPLILAAGRLAPEKGFDLLVEAFAEVARTNLQWRLEIVGDGPERSALRAQVAALGLDARVSLPGRVTDVAARMRTAGLFVLSSRHEAYPMVLCEALAAGAAIVATDCPVGPRELIDDGRNGVLVPTESPMGLAQAMSELINDPARRQQLGTAARAGASRLALEAVMADWDRLVDKTLVVFP